MSETRPHTDFDYADVTSHPVPRPDADPRPAGMPARRDAVLPYLNGRPCRDVQAANAAEGWVEVIDPHTLETKRFYGSVQLLWGTPERIASFFSEEASGR